MPVRLHQQNVKGDTLLLSGPFALSSCDLLTQIKFHSERVREKMYIDGTSHHRTMTTCQPCITTYDHRQCDGR